MAKKSNAPDAVLRTGLQPKPEKVVDAKNADGLVRKAIDTQVFTKGDEGGGGSDHHKLATNSWGVSESGKGR